MGVIRKGPAAVLSWYLWPPREDRLLNKESSAVSEVVSSLRPAMEDIVSVPLGRVKECGDQQSISNPKTTTEICSVTPQCQNSGKKFPGGVTGGLQVFLILKCPAHLSLI